MKRPERAIAASNHASPALGRMPGVQVFWHVLFLLWRHFGGVRLTRNTPGTEQRSCYIVFTQTRLSIVELTVAPVTQCHLGFSRKRTLQNASPPPGRNRENSHAILLGSPDNSRAMFAGGKRPRERTTFPAEAPGSPANLALHTQRLQRNGVVRTTNQHISADAEANGGAGVGAGIFAGEVALREPRHRCKHVPGERGFLCNTDVETHFLDNRDITIFRHPLDAQHASEIGDGSHDEADAGPAAAPTCTRFIGCWASAVPQDTTSKPAAMEARTVEQRIKTLLVENSYFNFVVGWISLSGTSSRTTRPSRRKPGRGTISGLRDLETSRRPLLVVVDLGELRIDNILVARRRRSAGPMLRLRVDGLSELDGLLLQGARLRRNQ